jgi:stage II sporulation protein AA (anti-sigma F factor antagonist)
MITVAPDSTPDCLCLQVRGQVDNSSAPRFQEALAKVLTGYAVPRCIFDLGEVQYISSAGLRVMLLTAKRVHNVGGRLVLCRLQPAVFDVLELAGFTRIMEVVPDLPAARERLGSG